MRRSIEYVAGDGRSIAKWYDKWHPVMDFRVG